MLRYAFFHYPLYIVLLFPSCFKTLLLQELAKKKAKTDKAGPSRPSSGVHPLALADTEDPEAGVKAPEGPGAKSLEGPKAPAPPPPQVWGFLVCRCFLVFCVCF